MKMSIINFIQNISFRNIILCIIILGFFQALYCGLQMDTYYEKEDLGLSVWVDGKSMISGSGQVLSQSKFHIGSFDNIDKVILVWSGEVKKKSDDFKNITIQSPGNGPKKIEADKVYKSASSGILYSCFADITSVYNGKGKYIIKDLRSDVFEKKGAEFCSVGGYAVIVVYRNPEDTNKKRIQIKSEFLMLRPGEIYDIKILEKGTSFVPVRLTIIGGHGLKGNASTNLINGQSISGKEDWDGSSGVYWDVDSFAIDHKLFGIEEHGLILSFDSLLQWIYPTTVVFEFEE
ncbi:MAG: hypothetical protein JW983_01670 [Elusimicrobia bacterium]|nr:hypothetical protein [Elusimicrobiota bacterium]